MDRGYKIIEVKPDGLYFLYKGLNGSRKITLAEWLRADIKEVRDGSDSRTYLSGFHFFKELRTAMKYLRRFRKERNYFILEVKVKNPRQKPGSEAWLAEEIFFDLTMML